MTAREILQSVHEQIISYRQIDPNPDLRIWLREQDHQALLDADDPAPGSRVVMLYGIRVIVTDDVDAPTVEYRRVTGGVADPSVHDLLDL